MPEQNNEPQLPLEWEEISAERLQSKIAVDSTTAPIPQSYNISVWRAKVEGGWMVLVGTGGVITQTLFIEDKKHYWGLPKQKAVQGFAM